MYIGIIVLVAGICILFGNIDDQENAVENSAEQPVQQEEIQFDPWVDEWYGEGPWWKKW